MSAWLFIFGRTHELSFHELSAFASGSITSITSDVARVEDPQEEIDPEQLIHRLGGTVKIAREKGNVAALSPETLSGFLEDERRTLTFGVSVYGDTRPVDSGLFRGMKKAIEGRGVHARYVAPKEGNALSSVVVKKQSVREFIAVTGRSGFIVGETVAVQDFEAWNERDYGRPFADPKAGMLPPKVARMAVNIAGESKVKSKTSQESKVLLDPFCGMGTILGEAALSGWQVIGSDQSAEVVEKARKNLEWLTGLNPVKKQGSTLKRFQLMQCDATHVSEHLPAHSVDAIVTEPFMGPAFGGNDQFPMTNDQIKNIIKGLEKLYIGCLREWYKVLKPAGKIVIALPQYAMNGKTFFVKKVIDRCETFGYTVTAGPLPYSREHAIVRRKFYVLVKLA